jgi:hypothetical protein
MTATVRVGPGSYTVVATPTQDSRGNWTVPTYTINGQVYNFPQDTTKSLPVFATCSDAEHAARSEARRVIAEEIN